VLLRPPGGMDLELPDGVVIVGDEREVDLDALGGAGIREAFPTASVGSGACCDATYDRARASP